jgi:hypothetical protein
MALILGVGFPVLAFLVLTILRINFLVAMLGITLLMPGTNLLQAISHDCCQTPLAMLAANGLIYFAGVFVCLVVPLTWSVPRDRLRQLSRSLTWAVLGTVAVVCAGAFGMAWVWSAPSDEAMKRQFNRHRNELEELASMAKEDSVMSRIAFDFTWRQDSVAWPRPETEWGIIRARWDQYRKLFRQAGVSEGLIQDKYGNVYFLVHTEGSVVGGASKGFVYCRATGGSPDTFSACSEQHDFGRHDDGKGNGTEYHRLLRNWYLYSDWD